MKRRSDKKIFNLEYDIFNQREIIVDGKSFKNITQAAKAFGLKNYSLQYAFRNEKTEIQRKSDGKVFSIASKRILNKNIQRKINEIQEYFKDSEQIKLLQNPKLDYCPQEEFNEVYENFCSEYERNYGEKYEPTYEPPPFPKKVKNYTLNVDY